MKCFLTKSLFLFLFTFSLSFQSFSQIGSLGPILNDHDGGGNIYLCLNNSNVNVDYTITPTLTIAFANLDLYLPASHTSKGNTFDYLPSGHPTMYLRYSVNGGPFERINLSEVPFELKRNQNGVNIFYAFVETYPINLSGFCNSNPEILGSFPFEMYLEEYTEIDGGDGHGNIFGYSSYPACDHTDPIDIFSCNVFYAAPYCGPDEEDIPYFETCDNEHLTSRIGTINYDCNCADQNPDTWHEEGFNGENGEDRNRDNQLSSDQSNNISIQPNPFNNQLELSWSDIEGVQNIRIINTNGKLINSWNQNQLLEKTKLDFNTQTLAKGLYFISIKTSTSNEILKVVKQ